MPGTYETRRPRQQAELLARLALGPTLAMVCRASDMPDVKSVSNWARADPAFAAQLTEARRRGDLHRAGHFDDALAAAFLARLQSGESTASILADPAMPHRRTFNRWKATDAAFAGEVRRAQRACQTDRMKTRWHCQRALYQRPWDRPTADAIYLRVLRGETVPAVLADLKLSRTALRRWRREQPELDLIMKKAVQLAPRARGAARTARHCSPELTWRIEHRILGGASLSSLSKEPDMPSAVTLYKWVRTRPAFAAAIASACQFRDDRYVDRVGDLAMTIGLAAEPEIHAITKRLGQLNPYPGERRER